MGKHYRTANTTKNNLVYPLNVKSTDSTIPPPSVSGLRWTPWAPGLVLFLGITLREHNWIYY